MQDFEATDNTKVITEARIFQSVIQNVGGAQRSRSASQLSECHFIVELNN